MNQTNYLLKGASGYGLVGLMKPVARALARLGRSPLRVLRLLRRSPLRVMDVYA